MKKPEFYRCGICDTYHRAGLGWQSAVQEIKMAVCPTPECGRFVKHYLMDGGDGVWCAECIVHLSQWYKLPQEIAVADEFF